MVPHGVPHCRSGRPALAWLLFRALWRPSALLSVSSASPIYTMVQRGQRRLLVRIPTSHPFPVLRVHSASAVVLTSTNLLPSTVRPGHQQLLRPSTKSSPKYPVP